MLCEECRDELSSPIKIMPEQIQTHTIQPTMAALIDLWGRPHRLEPRMLIGRQVDGQGLAILEPSVSRHHARLTLDQHEWAVRDLGSANGTFHDDRLISAPAAMHEGARVRFGHVAFYFVEDVSQLPAPQLGRTMTATISPLERRVPAASSPTLPEEPGAAQERARVLAVAPVAVPAVQVRLASPAAVELLGPQEPKAERPSVTPSATAAVSA